MTTINRMVFVLTIIGTVIFSDLKAQERGDKPEIDKFASQLIRVEPQYVCMTNNRVFNKEQIAVEVDGKMYYGCCEMCKKMLKSDPASRITVDPVTGEKIDKAEAVIGANSDGLVYYFETMDNLRKFKAESISESPRTL